MMSPKRDGDMPAVAREEGDGSQRPYPPPIPIPLPLYPPVPPPAHAPTFLPVLTQEELRLVACGWSLSELHDPTPVPPLVFQPLVSLHSEMCPALSGPLKTLTRRHGRCGNERGWGDGLGPFPQHRRADILTLASRTVNLYLWWFLAGS